MQPNVQSCRDRGLDLQSIEWSREASFAADTTKGDNQERLSEPDQKCNQFHFLKVSLCVHHQKLEVLMAYCQDLVNPPIVLGLLSQ